MIKIEDIYNEIQAYKDQLPELADLQPSNDNFTNFKNSVNSGSNVAVWRWFSALFAYASYVVRTLFEKHKIELEKLLAEKEPGTLQWYVEQLKLFQEGYTLEVVNGIPKYLTIDENAKIVKYAAGAEANGELLLKVAGENSSGLPEAIPSNILNQINLYINKKGFAGVRKTLISLTGDLIFLEADIYVDGLLINTNGALISDTSIKPVEQAILQYYKDLPFNGVFNKNALIDAIQAAEGVKDVVIHTLQYKVGSNPYININREYSTISGYVLEDPGATLSDNLNYII